MSYLIAILGLIGLCLGSFAATAGQRIVRQEQSIVGRSRCDHCGVHLGFLQTIPVVAYVRQGGLCRACSGQIDPTHLVGEITGAVLLVSSFLATTPIRAAGVAALGLVLLTSSVVDAKTRRLPDGLTLTAALLSAMLAIGDSIVRLTSGLAAAVLAFVVLEIVRRGFLRFRGHTGLGFGDVKLVAALALWLGMATPWALVFAALTGLAAMVVVRPRDGRLAFGPSIAVAGWTVGLLIEARLWQGPA